MGEKLTIWERFPKLLEIPKDKFPKHVFIIPDGNGRWAKTRKVSVTTGHRKGFLTVEKLLEDLAFLPVEIVTIWGFSADNWKRSREEIDGLMFIFTRMISKVINKLKKRNGRFIHLGRKDRIPKRLLEAFNKAEDETKENTGQIVSTAIDFGGEDQNIRTLDAARKLNLSIPTTLDLLWQLRDGKGLIGPADLLIRTSGEKRTSDVGWLNGASTELFFVDKLFPDIITEDILEAIVDFSKRKRRLGGRLK